MKQVANVLGRNRKHSDEMTTQKTIETKRTAAEFFSQLLLFCFLQIRPYWHVTAVFVAMKNVWLISSGFWGRKKKWSDTMRKSNSYLVKTQILLFHSRYPASSMRTPIASTHIVQVYSAFSVPRHICITFNSLYKNKYTRRMCVCAAARLAYAVLASRLKKAFWVRPGDSVRPSARERFHLFLSAPLSLPLYLSLSICAQ